MQTFCIHLPRFELVEAQAIYETKWDITTAGLFMQLLDELHDSIRERFSLEFYLHEQTIYICFAAEGAMIDVLAGVVYSMLPDAIIREIPDYTREVKEHTEIVAVELGLVRDDIFPLQNYRILMFESLSPVLNVMSRFPSDDRIIFQIVCQPVQDSAWLHFDLSCRRATERFVHPLRVKYWFKKDATKKFRELILQKCRQKLYWVNVRIAALHSAETPHELGAATGIEIGAVQERLFEHLEAIESALGCMNTLDENQIRIKKLRVGYGALRRFQERTLRKAFRLSTVELTTIWHPPRLNVVPNAAQVLSKKRGPPGNLPCLPDDSQICFFGHTDFRDHRVAFGILRNDRRRHLYLLGKSGTGKSCLIQLLIRNDIERGFGAAVLDPHGDLIDDVLRLVPEQRVRDVVLFDASDTEYPPSFNPLDIISLDFRMRATIGFIETFKRAAGAQWSDRMDHVLRYAMLAILNEPGATLLSLRTMLADERFRRMVLENVSDESVRHFWSVEFESQRAEFEESAVIPILNRIDELLSTDMVRNILGQGRNLFNFRKFIDERKIVLMKLPKGVLGQHNCSLLGSMLIAKIYEAAMSRTDISPEAREDFNLYIDEFDSFATETFDEILTESRKFGLCLTIAHQFLGQLPASVQKGVIGSVANLISFRIGGNDAAILAQELKPRFSAEDLVNLGLREFYIKMSINGEVQEAFSGKSLDMEYPQFGHKIAALCIEHSRRSYSSPLAEVRETLSGWQREAVGQ